MCHAIAGSNGWIFSGLDSRYVKAKQGAARGMTDQVTEVSDRERLIEEIARLRAQVAQLEQRVQQLDTLAHQDSLIDLPNRRGFMRELRRRVDRAKRYGERSAMLFVDIDGLKSINDSFGHRAGDVALIQVAHLMIGGVRKGDMVARLGGDEFGILLDYSDDEKAQETAARLGDLIADCEFMHDGEELPLSVAIGATVIGPDDDPESIMARADQEMYRRKAAA